jgi:septin family protein
MLPLKLKDLDQKNIAIFDDNRADIKLQTLHYSHTDIINVLPFRVRFSSIPFEQYGQNNPPGIGLQIIGINNYIL